MLRSKALKIFLFNSSLLCRKAFLLLLLFHREVSHVVLQKVIHEERPHRGKGQAHCETLAVWRGLVNPSLIAESLSPNWVPPSSLAMSPFKSPLDPSGLGQIEGILHKEELVV